MPCVRPTLIVVNGYIIYHTLWHAKPLSMDTHLLYPMTH